MKNIGYNPQNTKQLAIVIGLIDNNNAHLKYTEAELTGLIHGYIKGLEDRLEKAKKIYKEQRAKLNKLESPELWRFEAPKSVPPDYREEYLRKLKQGAYRPIDEHGNVLRVREKS